MIFVLMSMIGMAWACPDYVAAIEDAEQAARTKNYELLEESLVQAQRGLSCGPILENRTVRSSFWLSQAILLDAYGDRATSDRALVAAWRSDPDSPITRLPNHLRVRYAKVVEMPYEDSRFRLHPAPDPEAAIYVDGQPFQQRSVGGEDTSITTKVGLHIVQLAESPIVLNATAARVVDLSEGESEFDIYEEALLGRPLTPLKIGADYSRPAGGCGKR